jgi:hypothetical protein
MFIRNYIEDLLRKIRTQVLLKLIKPYTRIRIPFISKELNIPEKDVEHLLVSLILDNRVQGHIDQVNQLLELGDRYALHSLSLLHILPSVWACDFHLLRVIMKCQHSSLGHVPKSNLQSHTSSCLYVPTRSKGLKKYTAIDTWNTQLKSLYQTVTTRIG